MGKSRGTKGFQNVCEEGRNDGTGIEKKFLFCLFDEMNAFLFVVLKEKV